MPRPRVRPEDRQRSARACEPCKIAKKRCDSALPCRTCVKKGIVPSCMYDTSRGRGNGHRQRGTGSDLGLAVRHAQASDLRGDVRAGGLHGIEGASSTPPRFQTPQNSRIPTGQSPLMMLSSSGENVLVGNTAALSFLQFLRTFFKQCVGPSGFTEEQQEHQMLEEEVPGTAATAFVDDLDDIERDVFINRSFEASSGLLDLFTDEEMHHLKARANCARLANYQVTNAAERDSLASLYLMIAIGAQSHTADEREREIASRYFARSRHLLFGAMLQDPTISMIKGFLLAAFYMLGACRRTTAFMYIGVASKAAGIIGLHETGEYEHLPKDGIEQRRRVGRSVRVLDSVCSSILGRPCSTPPLRTDSPVTDLDPASDNNHRSLALYASYKSTALLESIVQSSNDEHGLSNASAEKYLQMLLEWSQTLPPQLRRQPTGSIELPITHSRREEMIGNIHIACTYYFGVILATRQCLISHTIRHLRAKHGISTGNSGFSATDTTDGQDNSTELTKACTEAATYIAQMCWDASEGGFLLRNMCVLKAWLFAAGLVLGFSLLQERGESSVVRNMFHATRRMLGTIGRLSPLSRQYYQILTSFYTAIKGYWQDVSRETPPRTAPYVVRILSPGPGRGVTEDAVVDSQYPTPRAETAQGTPRVDDFDIGEHFDFEPDLVGTGGFGVDDGSLHIVWSDMIDFMESFNPESSGAQ